MQRKGSNMTALPDDPEPIESESEATPLEPASVPPAFDPSQVTAATEAHNAAVTTAHNTLAQRLENAYSIFKSDLDRAYSIWEDVMQMIRQGAGLAQSIEGVSNARDQDPTTAR